MKPTKRSFGFIYEGTFIQGTVMQNGNAHEIAGLYGDKTYNTVQELINLANLPQESFQKILDEITNLVNSP